MLLKVFVRFFVLAHSPLQEDPAAFSVGQGKFSGTFTYVLPQFIFVALFFVLNIFSS